MKKLATGRKSFRILSNVDKKGEYEELKRSVEDRKECKTLKTAGYLLPRRLLRDMGRQHFCQI